MWWSHWQPSLFNEFTFKSSELTQSTYSSDWKGCEFGRGGGEVGGTLLSAVFVAYHFSPKFCLHFDGVCIFFFKASLYINSKDMFVPCSTVLIISCSFKKSFIRKIIIISRPPFPQPPSIEGYTHWSLQQLLLTLHITAYDVCGHIDNLLRFLFSEEFFQLCLFLGRDLCNNVPLSVLLANQRHEENARRE